MLTTEDATIIQEAMKWGTFWGSLWGAIAFHILFFGTIFMIYFYINRKYGSLGTIIENFIKKFT